MEVSCFYSRVQRNRQLFLITPSARDPWAPEPPRDGSQASCFPGRAVGGGLSNTSHIQIALQHLTKTVRPGFSLGSTGCQAWKGQMKNRARESPWRDFYREDQQDMVSQASAPRELHRYYSWGNSWNILYVHRFSSSKETTSGRCVNITPILPPVKPGLHPFPSTRMGRISGVCWAEENHIPKIFRTREENKSLHISVRRSAPYRPYHHKAIALFFVVVVTNIF